MTNRTFVLYFLQLMETLVVIFLLRTRFKVYLYADSLKFVLSCSCVVLSTNNGSKYTSVLYVMELTKLFSYLIHVERQKETIIV